MRIITLDTGKKVISVKTVGDAYVLQPNDIITDLGDMGQIQQSDGSFINDTAPIIPPVPEPTNKELYDNQMTLMSGMVDIYMSQMGF